MMLHVLEFDIGRKEIWKPIDTFEAKVGSRAAKSAPPSPEATGNSHGKATKTHNGPKSSGDRSQRAAVSCASLIAFLCLADSRSGSICSCSPS
jgi:hypothetical protein